MATVSKAIADVVAATKGIYPGDRDRVVKIVVYSNQFNSQDSYGMVYSHQDKMMYENSPACRNVRIYWEYKPEKG